MHECIAHFRPFIVFTGVNKLMLNHVSNDMLDKKPLRVALRQPVGDGLKTMNEIQSGTQNLKKEETSSSRCQPEWSVNPSSMDHHCRNQ